jgi:hypothetical protein
VRKSRLLEEGLNLSRLALTGRERDFFLAK